MMIQFVFIFQHVLDVREKILNGPTAMLKGYDAHHYVYVDRQDPFVEVDQATVEVPRLIRQTLTLTLKQKDMIWDVRSSN
jgi:hypothetical protein